MSSEQQVSTPPKRTKEDKLPWIKYNPMEVCGSYSELTDAEFGFLHRVISKLWAAPGNRLSREDLMTSLRAKPGSERDQLLEGLMGYALKTTEDGLLFVPLLDEAFSAAVQRGQAARSGAAGRWKAKTTSQTEGQPGTGRDEDF